MRQYEMTYLVSDKVSDADMNAATGKINALITSHKGKILGEENWGRRKLAYTIQKQDFATYVTLNFELKPEELVKINREIRLSKEIVRSIILVKDFGKEKITLSADEVAETSEIEEVVGGERSFEAVEGETEESYGLMAKREEASEEAGISPEETVEDAAAESAEEPKDSEADEQQTDEKVEEKAVPAEEVAKPKKKAVKKVAEEVKEEPKTKKAEKKAEKVEAEDEKEKKAEAEADRLAKLNEEIEGILGDDL